MHICKVIDKAGRTLPQEDQAQQLWDGAHRYRLTCCQACSTGPPDQSGGEEGLGCVEQPLARDSEHPSSVTRTGSAVKSAPTLGRPHPQDMHVNGQQRRCCNQSKAPEVPPDSSLNPSRRTLRMMQNDATDPQSCKRQNQTCLPQERQQDVTTWPKYISILSILYFSVGDPHHQEDEEEGPDKELLGPME